MQVLLGLIGESTGIAAKVLKSLGVQLKDARVEVEKIIGRGSGFVAVEIPFTPRAKRVLELSLEEARQLGAWLVSGPLWMQTALRGLCCCWACSAVAGRPAFPQCRAGSSGGLQSGAGRKHMTRAAGPAAALTSQVVACHAHLLQTQLALLLQQACTAQSAQQLAGQIHISTEHILLGLLQEGEGVAAELLAAQAS